MDGFLDSEYQSQCSSGWSMTKSNESEGLEDKALVSHGLSGSLVTSVVRWLANPLTLLLGVHLRGEFVNQYKGFPSFTFFDIAGKFG